MTYLLVHFCGAPAQPRVAAVREILRTFSTTRSSPMSDIGSGIMSYRVVEFDDFVGAEHLLIALLREGEGVAPDVETRTQWTGPQWPGIAS
jgi:hypothetical protein